MAIFVKLVIFLDATNFSPNFCHTWLFHILQQVITQPNLKIQRRAAPRFKAQTFYFHDIDISDTGLWRKIYDFHCFISGTQNFRQFFHCYKQFLIINSNCRGINILRKSRHIIQGFRKKKSNQFRPKNDVPRAIFVN